MTGLMRGVQLRLAELAVTPRRAATVRIAALLGRADLPGPADFHALRPATRVLIVALSAWIGLVLIVAIFAVASVQLSRYSTPAWLGVRGSAARTAQAAAMPGFDNIVQRPLFSRSRQATSVVVPVVAPAPPPPAPVDPGFILKGIFMNEGVAKAFLLTAQNPTGTWVQADGEIDGWRLVGIQSDQVVLDRANQRLAVPLTLTGGR
ncbi:hypothetical protein [Bradyrhizobium lablabi]|uniref:hypothetical protein n=1 Tax=Bradyrhizobium lablabi TaxID=722472 RepID=UPI001BA69D80|nr:hypothetical protein [Bradyrhizobium lablabi]MBR0697768.1 hypothetical protein [Bradyrhizobium lablabi]